MAVKSITDDGKGRGDLAYVEDNGLLVSRIPYPAFGYTQKTRIFRKYMTDDGLVSGSHDMLVDGDPDPVDFWVGSSTTADIYLTYLNVIMAYPSASAIFAEFADDGAALGNGIVTTYRSGGVENTSQDNIYTNGDFMRLSTDPDLVEKRSMLLVNDYGFVSAISLKEYMPPFGLKLDKGSQDRYTIRIQDDLTASNATLLNVVVYGFQRFE